MGDGRRRQRKFGQGKTVEEAGDGKDKGKQEGMLQVSTEEVSEG